MVYLENQETYSKIVFTAIGVFLTLFISVKINPYLHLATTNKKVWFEGKLI